VFHFEPDINLGGIETITHFVGMDEGNAGSNNAVG
jgi:hypothetical protein